MKEEDFNSFHLQLEFKIYIYHCNKTGDTALPVKATATKGDDLGLIPRTHMVEEKYQCHKCPLTTTHT